MLRNPFYNYYLIKYSYQDKDMKFINYTTSKNLKFIVLSIIELKEELIKECGSEIVFIENITKL